MKSSLKSAASVCALSGLALAFSIATASADIVITQSVNNQGTDNVLLNSATNVPTVTGTVGQNNLVVDFTSTSGNLSAPSNGQARVTSGSGNPFSELNIQLANNATFTNAVFNINAATDGSVNILVTGSNITNGSQNFTVDANGQNFFSVRAINGQLINEISLTGSGGATFQDVRQIRLGGSGIAPAVPEPSTWAMMLIGFAGLGFMAYRGKANFRFV